MSSIEVLLSGAAGRMGREINSVIKETSDFELVAEVDRQSGIKKFDQVSVRPNVIIDFSSPELFREAITWAVDNSVPFVSGTTGLDLDDFKAIESAAQTIPILWAANMSFGINLLLSLTPQLKVFDEYDFQVEEFHHNKKIDRPSGTAKVIQKFLEESLGRQLPEPMVGRGGGIFGIHKIWIMSEDETIVFEHTALNRRTFARSATKIAAWLYSQPPGQYQIADMLGLAALSV